MGIELVPWHLLVVVTVPDGNTSIYWANVTLDAGIKMGKATCPCEERSPVE